MMKELLSNEILTTMKEINAQLVQMNLQVMKYGS
jgi:hypothetical protein